MMIKQATLLSGLHLNGSMAKTAHLVPVHAILRALAHPGRASVPDVVLIRAALTPRYAAWIGYDLSG